MSHPVYEIVSYARTKVGVRAWNRSGNTTEFSTLGLSLNPKLTDRGFVVDVAQGEVEFRCSSSLAKSAMVDLRRSFAFVPSGWVDKSVRKNTRRRTRDEILLSCRAALRLWRSDLTHTLASAAACRIDRNTLIHHAESTEDVVAVFRKAKKARAILEANAGRPTVEVAAEAAMALNAKGENITAACFAAAKKYGLTYDRVRNHITRTGLVPVLKSCGVSHRAHRPGVRNAGVEAVGV